MKKKKGAKVADALVFYCAVITLCLRLSVSQSNTTTAPVKVGVVLDLSHTTAKIGLSCINMSLSDFYASHSHYNTRLLLHITDSHSHVITAASQAIDLIKVEQVQAIIGPFTSMEANFVISLGDRAHVPIVTFSATSPSLASLRSPYFFRAAQNDSAQVNAIGAIVQAFGWKNVVPIYTGNDYGKGIISFLTNALQQVYVQIPYQSSISASATDEDIKAELYKLMTMQTRVFVVHMTPNPGERLFRIAYEIGMMNFGYVWIVTDGLGSEVNSLGSSVIDSMQGVLGVRTYVPKTERLDDFKVRWRRKFVKDNPTLVHTDLNVFGNWAYDAATALAMAVEKAGAKNLGFDTSNNASGNFSNLLKLGVSENGENLSKALSETRFRGMSGEFSVIKGELQASTFEIINVNGKGERQVGFWTPEKGITRDLNFTSTSTTYSSSRNNLKPIIWPGDTTSVPKGWDNPTNEKKTMRIGVPVKKGFTEFVNVRHDRSTNTTDITGFCIDVFKAVLEVLPYAVPYEFIPFEKPDGEPAGTYDELIDQVSYGNLDAVVGDTTITAKRSNEVDFTMPYTESGGTMIVLLVENRHKSPWNFLKPLTWDLWVTTAFLFIFVAFVVWVLEHRINGEKVVSNCARFVVITWVFVVLILIQSYTASLTSLLTVQKLRPSVTDVNELIKNKLNVGYNNGSFVYGILKEMGFQDSQLIPYDSPEHCDELFTQGSAKGGIDAAFDEMPDVKIFLATHCSKYASTAPPTIRTDGYGYVFPKGSPLVADISRGILNVTQGDKMKTIENAWFKGSQCAGNDASVSSDNLSVDSFWGLFFIAGLASVSALFIFLVRFLRQHKHIWLTHNPSDTSSSSSSLRKRISALLKVFDDKDLSSHTYRKSESKSPVHGSSSGATEFSPSPSTHFPPSPSTQTASNLPQDIEISMVHSFPPSSSSAVTSPSNN
ncbi:hypothetical protein QN277_015294 [Acacia crassicarpa]|uniref:Glutamate receptor n=1 Tax=Acacia crassicarpa TaxID=499986 RepID=A0AAE1JY42_9FABA|nr:hypothetical protein QN277_015294 [Acacia crassicarpa]